MRYLFSFILFLFCLSLAFSQVKADTITLILKEPSTDTTQGIKTDCRGNKKQFIVMLSLLDSSTSYQNIRILPTRRLYCNTAVSPVFKKPTGIVHVNHSLYGFPLSAFRFENINQMANTVAGVLSMDSETPSILGARSEGTAYFINEVRVLEGFLPNTIEN